MTVSDVLESMTCVPFLRLDAVGVERGSSHPSIGFSRDLGSKNIENNKEARTPQCVKDRVHDGQLLTVLVRQAL